MSQRRRKFSDLVFSLDPWLWNQNNRKSGQIPTGSKKRVGEETIKVKAMRKQNLKNKYKMRTNNFMQM